MTADGSGLNIDLKENCTHSLQRSVEAYASYQANHDKMSLKDAILFLHHGIELLFKQILVSHSEYLIFDDLGRATAKHLQAIKERKDIFSLDDPPRTCSYTEAMKRVEAFVRPRVLTSKELKAKFEYLNKLRNQLEHYQFHADEEEVYGAFGLLFEPVKTLFETYIGDWDQHMEPKESGIWARAKSTVEKGAAFEKQVRELVLRFNGQQVEGHLMSSLGDLFVLPQISRCEPIRFPAFFMPDILAEGYDPFLKRKTQWLIEVKGIEPTAPIIAKCASMAIITSDIDRVAWIVTSAEVDSSIRAFARSISVLLSGGTDFRRLQESIDAQGLPPELVAGTEGA